MERLKSDDAVSAFFQQLSTRWARGGLAGDVMGAAAVLSLSRVT